MPITLTLNSDQIGKPSIVLTDGQLASIHQQEAAPPVVTPPATGVPDVVLPPEVAGRSIVKTPMAWANGAPRIIADLNDSNVWAIPFTVGAFTSGTLRGGEWQQQAADRLYRLIRNRDGAVIAKSPDFGAIRPGIAFVNVPATQWSGKVQLVSGEKYTLAIWNKPPTPDGSGRMFMELYVQ